MDGMDRRGLTLGLVTLLMLAGCGDDDRDDDGPTRDSGPVESDAFTPPDAFAGDAGRGCACAPGLHQDLVFLLSDDGELWSFDPRSNEFAFVAGPVCSGVMPFSMAVDEQGVAWILGIDSLSFELIDVNDPGLCEPSPYLRRNPEVGLFGTSFVAESETNPCSDLYVQTYSGDGSFDEGEDLGRLGVIDPITGDLSDIGSLDYDGGELTGTGDGRLYAFTGVDPVKIVELDRATGAELDVFPLEGLDKTNASAVAFYGGSIYIFTEAVDEGCEPCLQAECSSELAACRADAVCADHLQCVLETAMMTDACGGFLTEEVRSCVIACEETCAVSPRGRESKVIRLDLETRLFETVVPTGPIRVVGAASSPCVPVTLI